MGGAQRYKKVRTYTHYTYNHFSCLWAKRKNKICNKKGTKLYETFVQIQSAEDRAKICTAGKPAKRLTLHVPFGVSLYCKGERFSFYLIFLRFSRRVLSLVFVLKGKNGNNAAFTCLGERSWENTSEQTNNEHQRERDPFAKRVAPNSASCNCIRNEMADSGWTPVQHLLVPKQAVVPASI